MQPKQLKSRRLLRRSQQRQQVTYAPDVEGGTKQAH